MTINLDSSIITERDLKVKGIILKLRNRKNAYNKSESENYREEKNTLEYFISMRRHNCKRSKEPALNSFVIPGTSS